MRNRMLSLKEIQDAARMFEQDGAGAVKFCADTYGLLTARILLAAYLRQQCASEKNPSLLSIDERVADCFRKLGIAWFTVEEAKIWSHDELEERMNTAELTDPRKNIIRRAIGRRVTADWPSETMSEQEWETALRESLAKMHIEE